MNNNINLIALEGVDGVGKSTICKYIKEKYTNIEVYHDPDTLDIIGNFIHNIEKNNLANFSVNIWSLIHAASSINRQNLIKKYNVFTDRSAISTYVYYYELGIDFLEVIHKDYIFPKHIIYIYTDIDIIIKRLKIRDNENVNKEDIKLLLNNYETVLNYFEKNKKVKITRINNINIDETLTQIDNYIKRVFREIFPKQV